MSRRSTVVVLAVALVGVVVIAVYAHHRQSSQIDSLKSENHTLLLEKAQTAQVVKAFADFRAQANARNSRLAQKLDDLSFGRETSQSQLASVRLQLTNMRAQLAAAQALLETTQTQLAAAEAKAATAGVPNAAKTAADKKTKALCDSLGDKWMADPTCVTYYRDH